MIFRPRKMVSLFAILFLIGFALSACTPLPETGGPALQDETSTAGALPASTAQGTPATAALPATESLPATATLPPTEPGATLQPAQSTPVDRGAEMLRPDLPNPLAVWERSGGIAGVCYRLTLTKTGSYLLLNCKNGAEIEMGALTQEANEMIQTWTNQYGIIEWQTPKPGMPDAFVDRFVFYGSGSGQPSQTEIDALNQYFSDMVNGMISPGSPTG